LLTNNRFLKITPEEERNLANSIYPDETYAIVGAAMEVHRILGPGFSESIYQEALAIEFERQGIPFEKEKAIIVKYKDTELHNTFRADFVCYHDIIVELKALESTTPEHHSQVINYLKATGFKLGLLINFGERQLYRRRIINTSIFQK